jgi:hypothetical protein
MEKFRVVATDIEKYPPNSPESENSPRRTPTLTRRISHINEKKLMWKIDLSVLPILFCAYFLQFLDKVIYNVRTLASSRIC